MAKCKSFKPSVDKNCNILILGSMPGIKSLEEQQYYAHPQNRFWKIMGILCDVDLVNTDYNKKLQTLIDNNIALWDVIEKCERTGSLDSAIKKEKPNNIKKLLKDYPNIKIIALNGNKAYSAFKKYFGEILADKKYTVYKMPSTSPANARYMLSDLINEWSKFSA